MYTDNSVVYSSHAKAFGSQAKNFGTQRTPCWPVGAVRFQYSGLGIV